MSRAHKEEVPPVPPTITDNHASQCPLHGPTDQSFTCLSITRSGNLCRNKPHVFRSGMWPACGRHAKVGVLAARCRATVECGQACDRLVKADPPFNLCHIHEKGTDTLPCYFLEPSTEIRSAIFRWLLPEFVSCHSRLRGPDGKKSSYTALLRINKQISREASYVLYEQVPFEVRIHEDKFDMCNRVYDAGGFLRVGQYWPDLCRFIKKIFPKPSAGFGISVSDCS